MTAQETTCSYLIFLLLLAMAGALWAAGVLLASAIKIFFKGYNYLKQYGKDDDNV
jgi:hypothetical protein